MFESGELEFFGEEPPPPQPLSETQEKATIQKSENGLGKWKFDKKKKRRVYTCLNGKSVHGKDAVLASRSDQKLLRNTSQSTRMELQRLMRRQILTEESSTQSTSIIYDMTKLENWGVPLKVVAKYEENKVMGLFSWQIDCLMVQDGFALQGLLQFFLSVAINNNIIIMKLISYQEEIWCILLQPLGGKLWWQRC